MLFHKKKHNPEQPVLSPTETVKRIGENAGLLPEEIAQLLGTLSELETNRLVLRRKIENNKISKTQKMPIGDAAQYARERAQQRKDEEEQLRKTLRKQHKKYPPQTDNAILTESERPQTLHPSDISLSITTAHARLLAEQEQSKPQTEEDRRGQIILTTLDHIKQQETTRLARTIANRQERIGHLTEEELAAQQQQIDQLKAINTAEDEQQNTIRSLQHFSKQLHTLTDEAANVVSQDIDAATNIIKQWVGHIDNKD